MSKVTNMHKKVGLLWFIGESTLNEKCECEDDELMNINHKYVRAHKYA